MKLDLRVLSCAQENAEQSFGLLRGIATGQGWFRLGSSVDSAIRYPWGYSGKGERLWVLNRCPCGQTLIHRGPVEFGNDSDDVLGRSGCEEFIRRHITETHKEASGTRRH